MRALLRASLLLVTAMALAGCQLRSGDQEEPEQENDQQNQQVDRSVELPFSVITDTVTLNPEGEDNDSNQFIGLEENIVSQLESPINSPVYSFRYSPQLDQFLVAVGEEDEEMVGRFRKYRAVFLSEEGTGIAQKVLELDDNNEFIINPVFSADGISEIGWYQFNQERERNTRRIVVYNLMDTEFLTYEILPPSAVYQNYYDLAIFSDQFVFKTDRVQRPFASAVFTRAFRNNLQFNPVPLVLNADAYPQVLPVGTPISFGRVIGFREISDSEQEIFYTLRSGDRFYLISQVLSETPELTVLADFEGQEIVGDSEVAYERGVYFVLIKEDGSDLVYFQTSDNSLIRKPYDLEAYGEQFTVFN
jgi:hypothetical protein